LHKPRKGIGRKMRGWTRKRRKCQRAVALRFAKGQGSLSQGTVQTSREKFLEKRLVRWDETAEKFVEVCSGEGGGGGLVLRGKAGHTSGHRNSASDIEIV